MRAPAQGLEEGVAARGHEDDRLKLDGDVPPTDQLLQGTGPFQELP